MKKLFMVFFFIIVLVSMTFAQMKLYVNNKIGMDSYNGLSPVFKGGADEPKQHISNALLAAVDSTTIYIAATGVPYNESPTVDKVINFIGYNPSGTGRAVEIKLTAGDMVFDVPGDRTVLFNIRAISGPGYNYPAANRFQFKGTSSSGFYLKSGSILQGNAMFVILPPFRERR